MNHWTKLSIEYANQRSYLDDLFQVYPTIPEGIRDIDNGHWKGIEKAFEKRDNVTLLENILKVDLFPIKDSYVAYLKRDKEALKRNPATVARLCGRLYEMGLDEIYSRSSEPKETNRQIGPLFKRWLKKKSLGIEPVKLDEFLKVKGNTGKEWKGIKPPKGRHWRSDPTILEELDKQGLIEWSANGVPRKKIFFDEKEGKKIQDIWEFKDPQYPKYPTEKSLDLLKFIVDASSNEGDLMLDCFCGSGTTLIASQLLNRNWIGIDKSEQAIKITKKRISELPPDLFSESGFEFLTEVS